MLKAPRRAVGTAIVGFHGSWHASRRRICSLGQKKSRARRRSQLHPPRTMILFQGARRGAWYLHLNNPGDIAQRIGSNLLAAFMRCFVAVDRTASLTHLVSLSEQHGGPEDGHARNRNRWFLLLLMAGTMYEFGEALQGLAAQKVISKMGNRAKWDALDDIRRRWNKDPTASQIRNQLSHHLGDPMTYGKGLQVQLATRRLQLYCSDGPEFWKGSYTGAWSSVTRGLDLELGDYLQFFSQMGADFVEVHEALVAVFVDVLRTAGVPTENQLHD